MKVVYNTDFGGFYLSEEAWEYIIDYCYDHSMDVPDRHSINRTHPALVAVVEELGHNAAGELAELEIFESLDDRYYIEEYDGREIVLTPSTIEWVNAYH